MLFIYSGEVPEMDAALIKVLGSRHVLTTIPACPSDMASARHVTHYFRHVGLRARLQSARFYRDAKRLRSVIKNSDALYLMGGNTFEFLAYADHVGLFDLLRQFEADGGIIIGESAGSIILTPNIATALLPTSCPDDHSLVLESYAGMGRIPFHISPHYDSRLKTAKQDLDELQALAYYSKTPVMLLRDGEGLVIEGNEIVRRFGQPRELSPAVAPSAEFDLSLLPQWTVVSNQAA